MSQGYATFREFYPYYLGEHANPTCRRLHFVGSALILVLVGLVVARVLSPWFLFGIPVIGYGFAWAGHFFVEHNRPATFKHPLWSLMGDYKMVALMLAGRMGAEVERAHGREGMTL